MAGNPGQRQMDIIKAGHNQLNSEQQKSSRHSLSGLSDGLSPPRELYWLWLGIFVLAVAFLGGSSRPDPIQAALLRPIAALLLIPAVIALRFIDLERGKLILLLWAALLVWMVAQLLPLPPGLWQALPGRQGIAEIDQLAGSQDIWRPISLAPFRGLNSIFGMVIPLAALLLALAMRFPGRTLLLAIVAIALIDAAFGLLQVIGGSNSPLYMFAITSRGAPAGIFANENHSAVFSALVLLIVIRLALESRLQDDPTWIRLSLAPAFIFILLTVLITGSRAGFAATILTLFASAIMIWCAVKGAASRLEEARGKSTLRKPRILGLAGCATAIIAVAFAFFWFERTPAVIDIMTRASFEDLRWSLWPILRDMMADHWLTGTGFDSFDSVYRIYEPAELLMPAYVNHAHNDWAQLWIEGGLPGVVLLTVLLGWIGRSVFVIGRFGRARSELVIFWTVCIVILAAAALVDYPLRTPVFQTSVAWLLLCLSYDCASAKADKAMGCC